MHRKVTMERKHVMLENIILDSEHPVKTCQRPTSVNARHAVLILHCIIPSRQTVCSERGMSSLEHPFLDTCVKQHRSDLSLIEKNVSQFSSESFQNSNFSHYWHCLLFYIKWPTLILINLAFWGVSTAYMKLLNSGVVIWRRWFSVPKFFPQYFRTLRSIYI